ncbi:sugar O-acetyltransferase [Paraclostridium ghonii]|nr:sugar O-acetyltransferase [Paeniclostridium ghonii]
MTITEKEKLLKGEFYNTRDSELISMYKNARKLINKFNTELIDNPNEILKILLGNIEEGVWIEKPFFCDYGKHISIGENTFINYNCTFLDCNKITIGKNVLIGPGTGIYTATHPVNPRERININKEGEAPYKTYALQVKIGDNVWIGGNVSIMPGVTIGDNCVIGAGSVVTKSIPDNVLAVGNPCKVIKNIE